MEVSLASNQRLSAQICFSQFIFLLACLKLVKSSSIIYQKLGSFQAKSNIDYFNNQQKIMAQKEQLAVSYASFILSAQGAAITVDSVNAVLAAAKVKASANLVSAVVKALSGRNINEFFGAASGGSSAPAPAVAEKPAKQAAKPAEKPAEKPKPKQEPKAEEQEMDMGGLFD